MYHLNIGRTPHYGGCGCASGDAAGEYGHHHYACHEQVQRIPGNRECEVVLDKCLHDQPETCPYLRVRC